MKTTHQPTTPILSFREVHHAYPNGRMALRGITFDLYPGERVALVGGNGAGKSTLLLHTNGLLYPSKGSIHVDSLPLEPRNEAAIRRRVGMVFQESEDQLFLPTVEEDVAFGPRNMQLPDVLVERRVNLALHRVGISALRHRSSFQLSGGEKRCAAIATVLSMSPSLLVMDEPTAGLDAQARRRILQLLRQLPCTLLLATHDLELARELCPRTLWLHEGTLLQDAATQTLLREGFHAAHSSH
jgi:cobalt/nickel transport system ATP-binding protein